MVPVARGPYDENRTIVTSSIHEGLDDASQVNRPELKETMTKHKKLTTAAGAPVADNQNAITAGPRGPMLMQDVWYQEKLAHFDREVIPERRMHAKGSGAFGKFTVTHDITQVHQGEDLLQGRQGDRALHALLHRGR